MDAVKNKSNLYHYECLVLMTNWFLFPLSFSLSFFFFFRVLQKTEWVCNYVFDLKNSYRDKGFCLYVSWKLRKYHIFLVKYHVLLLFSVSLSLRKQKLLCLNCLFWRCEKGKGCGCRRCPNVPYWKKIKYHDCSHTFLGLTVLTPFSTFLAVFVKVRIL